MKKIIIVSVLFQALQFNNAVVGLNISPLDTNTIEKVITHFRNFKPDSILPINETTKTEQINFERYIYFGGEEQLLTSLNTKDTDIEKFHCDTASFRKIRKTKGNAFWYLRIENQLKDIHNFYVKVGNNKISEIHFFKFNTFKLTDRLVTGLNTKDRFDLLTPAFPVSIQTCEIIELLIYMPKRHYMLDMNTSINLSSKNLPISINSTDKELKDTMVYFFFYGAFICFYLFYLFVLLKLLNVFGKPLIRDSKGYNLRLWFTLYFFIGGLALIASTGVGYKITSLLFNKVYIFKSNPGLQQVLAYIESVSIHVLAALFLMVGFVLFKRGVPVFENVFWFKIIYYPTLVILFFIIIGSLLFKQLSINLFWLFYDFRTICFVVFNILGFFALSIYLRRTKNRFAFKLEQPWMRRIYYVYAIVLFSLLYAVLTTSFHMPIISLLPNIKEEPNPYVFIYTCLFIFAGLLTWFLFYRIDILMYKYFISNERIKEIGSDIAEERQRMKTEIHDEIGPMFTRVNLAINDVESRVTDTSDIQVLKRIKFTSQDIVKKIYTIVEDSRKPADFSLKSRILNYIEELQYTPGMTAFLDRYINIDESDYINSKLADDILMVIKELLNNAVKYSKGDLIELKLFEENDYLNIEVKDNGVGFDLRRVTRERRQKGKTDTGILGIKKRVKDNFGKIKINTSVVLNEGTMIQVKYPQFMLYSLPYENVTLEYLNLLIKDFIRSILNLVWKLIPQRIKIIQNAFF